MAHSYSIIVPHKDTPAYLKDLLSSIPERKDIQIIVLDDHSEADAVKEVISLCSARKDVELIRLTGHKFGAAYARNVGMDRSDGKWLLFADADDRFHDGFLDIIDKYKDSDYSIVYFNADEVEIESGVKLKDFHYQMSPVDAENSWVAFHEAWAKMFSAEYIRNGHFRFDEKIRVHEDFKFSFLSGLYSKRRCFSLDNVVYDYRIRKNSLVHNTSYINTLSRIGAISWYNNQRRLNSISIGESNPGYWIDRYHDGAKGRFVPCISLRIYSKYLNDIFYPIVRFFHFPS